MAYTVPVSISAWLRNFQQYVPSSDFKVFVQYDNSTSAERYDPVASIALQPGYNLLVLSAFGKYSGTASADIEAYVDVTLADVKFKDSSFAYTGHPISPQLDVQIAGTQIRPTYPAKKIMFPDSSSPLFTASYLDYDAFSTSYANNLNAGEASAVLSSKASNTSVVKTFKIDRRPIDDASVRIDGFQTDVDYNGASAVQSISVYIGDSLISSAYYTASYANNDTIGQAGFTLQGNTNLCGTVEKTFNIWGNLASAAVDVQQTFDYTGESIYASPQIKLFDIPLSEGTNYKLQYNGTDYIKPGIKQGLVVGLESGNVHPKPERSFQYCIVGNAASATVFGPKSAYAYTGSDIKPPFDVILDDIWLSSGIDYRTSYPTEDYSSTGKKRIVISGISNYTSEQEFSYDVYDPGSMTQISTLVYRVDGSVQTVSTRNLTRQSLGIDAQVDRMVSKVIVGSQVETLQDRLFSNCKMLTYVSFKNCDKDIELPDECFDGCFRLQTVVFPGQHTDDSFTVKKYAYGNRGYVDIEYIPTSHTGLALQLCLDGNYDSTPIVGFSSVGQLKINNDYRLAVPSQSQMVLRIGGIEWTCSKNQMLKPGSSHTIDFSHYSPQSFDMLVDGVSAPKSKKEHSYIDRVLSHSLHVFGQSGQQTTNAAVERLRIYEDGVLKMDLVPATDAIGIGCLVDTLTEKKYYSENGHDIACTDEQGQHEYCFVEFDPNGGTASIEVKKVNSGDTVGTLPQASREGHAFSAWIDSSTQNEVSASTVVDNDISCIAKWLALTKLTIKDPAQDYSIRTEYYNVNGTLGSSDIPNVKSDNVDSLYVGDGVTSLASSAFDSKKLVHVYLTDKIVHVPYRAFSYCSLLQSITFGSSTSSIGDKSFYSTAQLSSLDLPQTVSSIGAYAFYSSGLTALDLSRLTSLEELNDSAFRLCRKLSSVKLPNSLLSIGNYAFSGCDKLTSINLPGLLQTIGANAFQSNTAMASLSVHPHVESVGANAFGNCSGLQRVVVDDINSWNGIQFANNAANPLYRGHYLYDASNDGALVEKAYISCDDVKLSSIGPYLYVNCYSLKDAVVENGVLQIGAGAFSGCHSLSSVVLANSVSSIETSAFSECSSLTSINVPSGLVTFGSYVLGRSGISSLLLSSASLCSVSTFAFTYSSLNSISVDGTNLSIGTRAFENCSSLTCAYLGKGVDSYTLKNNSDYGLFPECSTLVDVTLPFDSSSRYAMTQINDREGICYPFGKNDYPASRQVKNRYYYYHVPQSLRRMTVLDTRSHTAYEKLFENLSMLSCVQLGDSILAIRQRAFYNCSGMQKIVVPSSVTSIDADAFVEDDSGSILRNLACVAFEGRSRSQVERIEGYPWRLDESTISCELEG